MSISCTFLQIINKQSFPQMKDLKFKQLISGFGGKNCILCNTKLQVGQIMKESAKVPINRSKVPINRSLEETFSFMKLYEDLVNEKGVIPTKVGDLLHKKDKNVSNQIWSKKNIYCRFIHLYVEVGC